MAVIELAISEVELYGVKWRFRFIPMLKFDELQDAHADAYRPLLAHMATHPEGRMESGCAECGKLAIEGSRALRPHYREAVRWGLAGCDAPEVKFDTNTERLDGRDFPVLSRDYVDRLAHLANGELVNSLGEFIMQANRISPREALGFS